MQFFLFRFSYPYTVSDGACRGQLGHKEEGKEAEDIDYGGPTRVQDLVDRNVNVRAISAGPHHTMVASGGYA